MPIVRPTFDAAVLLGNVRLSCDGSISASRDGHQDVADVSRLHGWQRGHARRPADKAVASLERGLSRSAELAGASSAKRRKKIAAASHVLPNPSSGKQIAVRCVLSI
jgi:hypothetical protein